AAFVRDWAPASQIARAASDHDIGRLEVAMDDTNTMRCRQGIRDLNRVFERLGKPHPFSRSYLVERLAIDKLHGNECSVACSIAFGDSNNVGVIQRSYQFASLFPSGPNYTFTYIAPDFVTTDVTIPVSALKSCAISDPNFNCVSTR